MNNFIKVTTLDNGILQVSLNCPEQRNILSLELLHQLSTVLEQAKEDTSVRAILLTGEGNVFSAGADIKQLAVLSGEDGLAFAHFGQAVFRRLELLGKPSLAAIQGFALGGGCELVMSASLRIAANNAVLGQPEIKLGLIPGFGGTQRLARLVGKGRALELCLTGRRINTNEALDWGLINEITTPDNLIPRAKALLTEITKLGTFAQQSILTNIHQGYDLTLEEALELEAAYFSLCCTTADKKEGVTAFLEKRTAVFSGAE